MSQNVLRTQPLNQEKVQTDKNWIYIFAVALGVFFIVTIYAMVAGKPELLSKPLDPDNRPCGLGDLEDYPYIYFVNPQKKQLNRNVCVKECPSVKIAQPGSTLECARNSVVTSCKLNIGRYTTTNNYFLIYDSYAYINKVCLPANAKYFENVRDQLRIGKIDLIFSDIVSSSALIFFYGILCSLLSYYTKYFLDTDKIARITYYVVFFLSSFGCFILGVVFFNKFVSIIFDSPANKKDVISSSIDTYSFTSGQNSSSIFYLFASLACFWQFFGFIKDQLSSDTMKNHEIRIKMLNNIPEVINSRKYLEFVPVVAFFVTLFIFIIFYIVERNIFSIVTIEVNNKLSPFDHMRRGSEIYILNAIIIPIIIWMISLVIQICEYITIQSTYLTCDRQQDQSLMSICKEIMQYRIGTIIKGAFFIGFTDWIRTPLEMIEFNYQEYEKKNKNTEPNFVRKFQRFICQTYQKTSMKSYTKYAYIDNIRNDKEFVEAGLYFQNEILDKNRWIENLVDMSEIFENQLNISICMIITIAFYLSLKLLFSNSSISSYTTTSIFVLALSFLISLFQVNLYGTTYCCIILQYTISQIESSQGELTQAKFLNYLKNDFESRMEMKFTDGEKAPPFIKFCNQL